MRPLGMGGRDGDVEVVCKETLGEWVFNYFSDVVDG